MLRVARRFASFGVLALAFGGMGGPIAQDLVLRGVHVYTGTDELWPEDRLVVKNGRIAALGSRVADGVQTIDLRGAFVVPGLCDAHAHLSGLGAALRSVDLVGTKSYAEMIERIVARAKTTRSGEWILGRGWDQNDWADKRFPLHAELSRALPDHPVWMVRIDGHAAFANARAMEVAGVTRASRAPSGGEILLDDAGEPSGVFVDTAMSLVGGSIPEIAEDTLREDLLRAHDHCVALGLTAIHDAGMGDAEIAIVRELLLAGRWHLRVHAMLPMSAKAARAKGPWQTPDGMLVVRAVKAYADGALGSRGAALLEPYADRANTRGLMIHGRGALEALARECHALGFQLCTHAIGDAANRIVLDAYEAAVPAADRERVRFRIEHAQVVHRDDFARFARLSVIPSMQPTHMTSDMPWAPTRLGAERTEGAYAWTTFLALGLPLPFGSDFPVESADPRLGLYAAITTRAPDGSGPPDGFRPSGALDRKSALRSFTLDAAFAAFAERDQGSIEVGKRADFTILDRDLLTCDPSAILDAKVLATVVDGRFAFRAEAR